MDLEVVLWRWPQNCYFTHLSYQHIIFIGKFGFKLIKYVFQLGNHMLKKSQQLTVELSVPQSCWMCRNWLFLDTAWVWKTWNSKSIQSLITYRSENKLLWSPQFVPTLSCAFLKNENHSGVHRFTRNAKMDTIPFSCVEMGSFCHHNHLHQYTV